MELINNQLMWLVKKAATKVYSIGQNVLREQSEVQKLINDIISNSHQVMPIRKMGDLASESYKIEQFEQIVDFISNKLEEIKFERKSLKKRLNVLVLVTYLIKHGAGGFIDQFRAMLKQFSRYQNIVNFLAQKDQQMSATMQEIRQRAKHIRILLMDNTVLLREKEVGRLIKEKLFIQTTNGDYSSFKKEEQRKQGGDKVEEFLQHYVWRYTQKIDQKLDELTDILIAKIDQYLDGDIPEDFQIDQAEITCMAPSATKSEFQLGGQAIKKEENKFIESKLVVNQPAIKEDLLELDRKVEQDLIVFAQQPCEMKENLKMQSNKIQTVPLAQSKLLDDEQIQMFRSELLKSQMKNA